MQVPPRARLKTKSPEKGSNKDVAGMLSGVPSSARGSASARARKRC